MCQGSFLVATVLATGFGGSACMPPSVRAVDGLLNGLAGDDPAQAARFVVPQDRPWVERGMRSRQKDPTAPEALALPPRPLRHELLEISSKGPEGHVVLAELTLNNPLPAVSKKLGHELPDFPKTRKLTRRFLSVPHAPGEWGVKLDLAAAHRRAEFVRAFEQALVTKDFSKAQQMLRQVPPPPHNGRKQPKEDRLRTALRAELDRAQQRAASKKKSAEEDTDAPPEPEGTNSEEARGSSR